MLELRAVSKRFSGIPAVDNVSFIVRAGEVTGYLGPAPYQPSGQSYRGAVAKSA
jgi:ABC-type branched-subunit amino acid transport system ATPase component